MNRFSLGEVATVSNGKTPPVSEQRGSGFPVLKIRDVDSLGNFRGPFGSFVDGQFAAKFNAKQLEQGDTLILNAAHNADYVASKTFYAKSSLGGPLVTGEWTIVRPNPATADSAYIRHFIESSTAKQQLKEMVNGIHLYPKDVARLSVPLPPLPEQRRIAAILDKADALRAKRREAIAKLDQLLQSVFIDMFGDPVTNPKGWAMRPLGQLCDVRDGTHDSPKYVTAGYPLLTSRNLSEGHVSLDGAMLISEDDYRQINKRSQVHKGDLLMPMIGTVGSPVLVDHDPTYAVKNVAILKFRNAEASNIYVLHLLRSHYFDWVTSKRNRGGTQKFIALGDIRSMPVPSPARDLQERFSRIVANISNRTAHARNAETTTEKLFSSLQTAAFSGGL